MIKNYKAIAHDKSTATVKIVTVEASTKQEAVESLRKNGYRVDASKVKEENLFNYIISMPGNYTDWSIRKIPF